MLTVYRRHTEAKCSSTDSQHCTDKRRPCPIWARGTTEAGTYVRQPLKTRDWAKAQDRARDLEATGRIPTPAPANVQRVTIEMLKDHVIRNKQTENLAYGTIKKYKTIFRELVEFAKIKGIRYVDELDLVTLQDFRNTWKVQSLAKSIKQGNLQSILKFALTQKWITENPATSLGKIKVHRTQQLPFTDDEMSRIFESRAG